MKDWSAPAQTERKSRRISGEAAEFSVGGSQRRSGEASESGGGAAAAEEEENAADAERDANRMPVISSLYPSCVPVHVCLESAQTA